MKTLNLCYHFTFFIITCCSCCCSRLITTSRAVNINKTNEINIGKVEVIFNNKTILTHESVELVCEVKPETAALAIVWMKENEIIFEDQRVKFGEHKIIINRTMESDTGYYTCSVMTPFGIQNKTALLTVIESEEEDDESQEEEDGDYSGESEDLHPCGSPRKELTSGCDKPYGFPNCKSSFAPAVNVNDIEITQMLDNSSSFPTLRMKVQWKVPKAGNSDIWGWQIIIVDVGPLVGFQRCVQVNRKYIWESKDGDLYVNYTFDKIRIHLGAKLKLTIQSLPAMDMTKSVVKKIISIKGHCDVFPELPCCYVAKNIVVEQMDTTSATLSWPDLPRFDSTLLSGFVVKYNSTNLNDSCHQGLFETSLKDAQNQSRIMVQELRLLCQNYTFQVIPIFNNYGCRKCAGICDSYSKEGRSSKLYFFRMTIVQTSALHHSMKQSIWLKAVVVVVVVLAITIFSSVGIIIWKKKRAVKKTKEPNTIPKRRPVTEVFIAHGSHCKDCEDAVLSVATYLDMTGHCKCIPNLRSLPKEWSPGMTQYYENQIAKCQKVIVLFTVNENYECEDNIKERNFIYQKNLIRSELLANYSTTKFIPVYMDFLSDLDIPCFLRNKKSFSLPSQLTELVLYITGEPVCKPVSVCPRLSLEEDSSLIKHKKLLEAKIKDLNVKHQKKLKIKNNNTLAKIV